MSVLIKESGGINNVGFTPSKKKNNVGFKKVDCQNYVSSSRQRTLDSGAQHVFDCLKQMQEEDLGFFCAVQGDFDNTSGNIFWADANTKVN